MVPTIYLQGEHSLPCCQTEVSLQKILQLYVEYGLCNIVESVKYTHQFFRFFGKIFVNITFNSQNDFFTKTGETFLKAVFESIFKLEMPTKEETSNDSKTNTANVEITDTGTQEY